MTLLGISSKSDLKGIREVRIIKLRELFSEQRGRKMCKAENKNTS
jgi:hypothetical protein